MYETFITISAMVRTRPFRSHTTVTASNMALLMLTECTPMGKRSQTDRTFITFFPGMCLQMVAQGALVRKNLQTDLALVQFHARVDLLVIF